MSAQEAMYVSQQNSMRSRVQELTEKIAKEKDDYLCMSYENELRSLMSKIVFEDNEVYSVDELIRQARETRKNYVRSRAIGVGFGRVNPTVYSGVNRGGFSDRVGEYYTR
jgi:hypothetical protein